MYALRIISTTLKFKKKKKNARKKCIYSIHRFNVISFNKLIEKLTHSFKIYMHFLALFWSLYNWIIALCQLPFDRSRPYFSILNLNSHNIVWLHSDIQPK